MKTNYFKNKYYLLCFAIIVFASCNNENNDYSANKLLLLQVDYQTKQFEGGKELFFSSNIHDLDTIPIKWFEDSPWDFQTVRLSHTITNDTIFVGTNVWCGVGSVLFPANLNPPLSFNLEGPSPNPGLANITNYCNSISEDTFSQIWNIIGHLSKVHYYMNNGGKVGLFLFKRGGGISDPADWDWFILFYR